MRRYRLLILSYACEPHSGSEYGVGWNVPVTLAMRHNEYEVFVLTRGRCKDKINKEMANHPIPNLHFLFYNLPYWLSYKKEMQSNWGEQFNYILWQFLVKDKIKEEDKKYHFSIIHHLTFNQFRTPSPGFFLDVPFVMGPVGGAETINSAFYQDLQIHTIRKEKIRNKNWDLRLFRWWCKRKTNKKYFIFSSKENLDRIKPYSNNYPVMLEPAIAFDPKDFLSINCERSPSAEFEMIYAGKAWDWKGLHLFLKAAKSAFVDKGITNFNIKIIGIRFEDEKQKVKNWIEESSLNHNIELIPFVERKKLLGYLSSCNLSVYPAFRDSGSMSVLESSVMGCPTVCFDTGGQDVFPDDILLKVQVANSYNQNLRAFSEKLYWAYCNQNMIKILGEKAKKYVYNRLTWDKRVDFFCDIYKNMLSKDKH